MRTFKVLLLACAAGILFSSAVLWHRRYAEHRLKKVVLQVERQSARPPINVSKPASPLEPQLQGVNEYLWIESWNGHGSKTRTIAVDKTVTRLVVSATGEPHGCVLRAIGPLGNSIEANRPKTQIFELENGTAYSIDHPQAGPWQWVVTGEGQLTLWARAASKTGLDSLTLRNQKTNKAIDTQAGEEIPRETPLIATVRLTAPCCIHPQFFLITEDGTRLSNKINVISLKTGKEVSERRQMTFHLSWSAPESNFRLEIESRDIDGGIFQRVTEPLLHVVAPA